MTMTVKELIDKLECYDNIEVVLHAYNNFYIDKIKEINKREVIRFDDPQNIFCRMF